MFVLQYIDLPLLFLDTPPTHSNATYYEYNQYPRQQGNMKINIGSC